MHGWAPRHRSWCWRGTCHARWPRRPTRRRRWPAPTCSAPQCLTGPRCRACCSSCCGASRSCAACRCSMRKAPFWRRRMHPTPACASRWRSCRLPPRPTASTAPGRCCACGTWPNWRLVPPRRPGAAPCRWCAACGPRMGRRGGWCRCWTWRTSPTSRAWPAGASPCGRWWWIWQAPCCRAPARTPCHRAAACLAGQARRSCRPSMTMPSTSVPAATASRWRPRSVCRRAGPWWRWPNCPMPLSTKRASSS